MVTHRGERGAWMGLIGRGMCAILSPTSREEVVAVLRVGGNIGEGGLFGRPREADALALTWLNLQAGWKKKWGDRRGGVLLST